MMMGRFTGTMTLSVISLTMACSMLSAQAEPLTQPVGTDQPALSQPSNPSANKTQLDTPKSSVKTPQGDALVQISTPNSIYRHGQSLVVQVTIQALKPMTLRYDPKQPQSLLGFDVTRLGFGTLESLPDATIKPAGKSPLSSKVVTLKPNQTHTVYVNLKSITGIPTNAWETGEYMIKATLYPQGRVASQGGSISAQRPLFVMLVD